MLKVKDNSAVLSSYVASRHYSLALLTMCSECEWAGRRGMAQTREKWRCDGFSRQVIRGQMT